MRILVLTSSYVLDRLPRFCSVGSPETFRRGSIGDWPGRIGVLNSHRRFLVMHIHHVKSGR